MKSRLLSALAVLLLAASFVSAGPVESVLTSDSTLWTASAAVDAPRLELTKRNGELREVLVVPGTDDDASDSEARLAWDRRSNTLFVMWNRAAAGADEIRLVALRADGSWSDTFVIASDGSRRAGLQLVMTALREEPVEEGAIATETTFLHAAWWRIEGDAMVPEYALVAFERDAHVSTDVGPLVAAEELGVSEPEDTGAAIHPPLTMARSGEGVEVIYGEPKSTAVTRVKLDPRRVESNARMWRPGRSKGAERTPSARLISADSDPVQAFTSKGRIVLYTPDAQFRFVVFENGQWSPTRMIQLDENLSSDLLLRELRRTVDEQTAVEETAQQ